jgi:membrane-associated protein
MIAEALALFKDLDQALLTLVENHGRWSYFILFLVLACEVGLVVTPFVPGETLLFAAGALAAMDALHMPTLLVGFIVSAILGNISGYSIGRVARKGIGWKPRFLHLNAAHVVRTRDFFNHRPKYALIYSRFLPIVRALAPFVAGTIAMSFGLFVLYSAIGGALWVIICTFAGYLFGHLPIVKDNFSMALIVIIAIVCLPGIYSAVAHWRHRKASQAQ